MLLRLKEEGGQAIKAAVAPGSLELHFQSGELAAWLPARTECRGEPRPGPGGNHRGERSALQCEAFCCWATATVSVVRVWKARRSYKTSSVKGRVPSHRH
ncbi:hypothetical protein NDU88_007573 [Pleurodeles waltl]|uniref:Uncharacterized protein n=1 Tax=Pleurodeles waltl TaxID=8319 RepID=A0AAV7U1V3_PLEWA|nr:hypothetical protein NDU88_007573 [Pleurodeles waltl]